ncbi:MAG TPA: glycosyltransferase 87 family protein, partial [Thermomicrobiales bacterium]|nr:glycosyltransferase 87 family protein [Thermomicrobiales bacterium]
MDGTRKRRELQVARVLAAAGLVLFGVWSARPAASELSYGFASYYTAAKLVRDGAEPARFYENRWFLERSINYGFVETPDIYFVNPPPTALVFLPLTALSPERADLAWTLANLGLLAAALAVLFAALRDAGLRLDWRGPLPWALLALALVFNPI